jgi:hypothetical protein
MCEQWRTESYKSIYKEQIISLLKPDIINKHAETITNWNWQYEENPNAADCSLGTVLLDNNLPIGFIGHMPVKLKYNGDDLKAVWGLNLIISPACRGKGYGRILVGSIKNIGTIVLGLGISDINAHLLYKQGYRISTDIEKYLYIRYPLSIIDLPKMGIQYLSKLRSFTHIRKYKELTVGVTDASWISDNAYTIDNLWRDVEAGYTKIVKRDYLYMNWKYASSPRNKYRCVIIHNNNDLAALAIFRESADISLLVDYLGPAKDIRIKYLIVDAFKAQCAHSYMLECISSDKEMKQALAHAGFRKYRERPRFLVYSPITTDSYPENNWFVMGGDSDNDM